jgi:hypothetical protein
MPGVADVLALHPGDGFVGAVISGAGPTMLLMHELSRPDACGRVLNTFRHHDRGAELKPVTVADGYCCMYRQSQEIHAFSAPFPFGDIWHSGDGSVPMPELHVGY